MQHTNLNLMSYGNQDGGDDDEDEEHKEVKSEDLIFLPFHPVFRFFVMVASLIKSVMGPLSAIYPLAYCVDYSSLHYFIHGLYLIHAYIGNGILVADLLLHIMHKKLTDHALKREHLPKSGLLLGVDFLSLIPLFPIVGGSCPKTKLWPNLVSFVEFFCVYRIAQYFSIRKTHSYLKILIASTLTLISILNCLTCLLILFTAHGFCSRCPEMVLDWRTYIVYKVEGIPEIHRLEVYIHGFTFVTTFVINRLVEYTKPATITEHLFIAFITITANLLTSFLLFPKLYAEILLRIRRICDFIPHVRRILEETRFRNKDPKSYDTVKNFYSLVWAKRDGITCIPEIVAELPRHLRIDIRQDLVWQLFFHSPTLRRTSSSFKRYICEFIHFEYKLPYDKFYSGHTAHSNMYYIKSGIIQIMCSDDPLTPLVSLTEGTILGDINFYVAPKVKDSTVRCLTYCEVIRLSRVDILKTLHKFPEDRKNVLLNVKSRLQHARTLNSCKQLVKGIDRTEDEGIAWLKRRWWEIFDSVTAYRRKVSRKSNSTFSLPPEENAYHCAKYIGQLALCGGAHLNRKSMFLNVSFPWILKADSTFVQVWRPFVQFTAFLVLILYPKNITLYHVPYGFKFFCAFIDVVYISDVLISLMTSMPYHTSNVVFTEVMFARCKKIHFFVDVLSALWIENLFEIVDKPDWYYPSQCNRILKIYVIFLDNSKNIDESPIFRVMLNYMLIYFAFCYITGWLLTFLIRVIPDLTLHYWIQGTDCNPDAKYGCDFHVLDALSLTLSWVFDIFDTRTPPKTLVDTILADVVCIVGFLFAIFGHATFIAAFYLRAKDEVTYQNFSATAIRLFKYYKIHPGLLIRLEKFLDCHWKYYKGSDIMNPNYLRDEPYDIVWHIHGEVAFNLISSSLLFQNAQPALIKDIANRTKYMILPRRSSIMLVGDHGSHVAWLSRGSMTVEYPNESGDIVYQDHKPGRMISFIPKLIGLTSFRTYVALTDCEIIYINMSEFIAIMKRHPQEWFDLELCVEEVKEDFKAMFAKYESIHAKYQTQLKARLFLGPLNIAEPAKTKKSGIKFKERFSDLWIAPESKGYLFWCGFRVLVVIVSVVIASMKDGTGLLTRSTTLIISSICDTIAVIDITLKFFLAYYNKDGIIISDAKMRAKHYMMRGFVPDLIGAIPLDTVLMHIGGSDVMGADSLLANTMCKVCHIYLISGFFGYMTDHHHLRSVYLKIVNWQIMILLISIASSQYFVSKCLAIYWDKNGHHIVNATRRPDCWLPEYVAFDEHPTPTQISALLASSVDLAVSGMLRLNMNMYFLSAKNFGFDIILLIMGFIFWIIVCRTITLLVLVQRRNTVFMHSVSQFSRFLRLERLDTKLIDKAIGHFRYWWIRTDGIDLQPLMHERVGAIFRQDVNLYFYSSTLLTLNRVLKGGWNMERELASHSTQVYFMPGDLISREKDLQVSIFIVHRGEVVVSRKNEVLATLTQGCAFGQLQDSKLRPIKITAQAKTYVDLLQIPLSAYHEVVSDEVRENIGNHPNSANDFLHVVSTIVETETETVLFLLKSRRQVKFPWMSRSKDSRSGTWYSNWLFISWVLNPVAGSFLALFYVTRPDHVLPYSFHVVTSVIHLMHMVTEFYTLELIIVNDKCVNRQVRRQLFKRFSFYLDALTVMVSIFHNTYLDLVLLIRLRLLVDFNKLFSRSFRTKCTPALISCILVTIIIHALTCGWMIVACNGTYGVSLIDNFPNELDLNKKMDTTVWVFASERTKSGCNRLLIFPHANGTTLAMVKPKSDTDDYIVALTFVVQLYTRTDLDLVIPTTALESYYKIFMSYVLNILYVWIASLILSAIYAKVRELYQYHHEVNILIEYLGISGVSQALLKLLRRYMGQLWDRQSGNWLPELAHQAPLCLREDILGALYRHHFENLPLFETLPEYFSRQLVTRLKRVVVFPGKCIIKEGDIYPSIFFIHEGDVEKWHYDTNSSENKLVSVLTMGGHFGVVQGILPDTPHYYTYEARTVVDLVFLRHKDWLDLLEAYPQVRDELYAAVKVLKAKANK